MKQIGFIGMGNMAGAMAEGIFTKFAKEDIIFSEADQEKGNAIQTEKGITYVESNQACVKQAKYVILAVKPQYMHLVTNEIKPYLTKEHVILSIMAGVSIAKLLEELGSEARVVRAMPNTPALVQEGMTGISYEESLFSSQECDMIWKIFTSFGKVQKVEEKLIDVVTCVSGSSPAYVYLFIEALADSAVKYGLPRKTAYEMAAQAVLGSAKMVLETGEHPASLKDKVCSPAGTTIMALSALEENGFRNAIIKATDACYKRLQ